MNHKPDTHQPKIHTPVLEDAFAHGHGHGDEALSRIGVGDCVAVMAPGDAPNHIIVRVTAIEKTRRHPESMLMTLPELIVGRIEDDQSWGPWFRSGDPAYQPGALIRFGASNISRIY